MSVTIQQREANWLIRMQGQITLGSAGELKDLLLEWMAAGKDLELDLEAAEEVDIAILQLLWVASREAARAGVGIAGRASSAADAAVRDSGFAQVPGFPVLRSAQ